MSESNQKIKLEEFLKDNYNSCFKGDNLDMTKLFKEIEKHYPSNHEIKIISHEIQGVGKISITLHQEAASLYENLLDLGIIDHLKEVFQLGVISTSNPSATHKRWDYVCIQLLLFQKLKYSSIKVGLSSKNISDFNISSEVFFQIIILLNNIGQFHGTISDAKAYIQTLKSNPKLKREFIKKFKSKEWKQYVSKIIDENDYYKAKNILTLEYIIKNYPENHLVYKVFKFFILETPRHDSNFLKLVKIYHRIRRLSYIYLDSLNSNVGFNIPIQTYFINIEQYETFFNPNASEWDLFLNELEKLLTKKLYISQYSAYLHKKRYDQSFCEFNSNHKVILGDNNKRKSTIIEINKSIDNKNFDREKNDKPLLGQIYFTVDDAGFLNQLLSVNFIKIITDLNVIEQKFINSKSKKLSFIILSDYTHKFIFFTFIFSKFEVRSAIDLKKSIYYYIDILFEIYSTLKVNENKLSEKSLFSDNAEILNFYNNSVFKSMNRKSVMYLIQMITKYKSKTLRYNPYITFNNGQTQKEEINNIGNYMPFYSDDIKILRKQIVDKLNANDEQSEDKVNCLKLIKKILGNYKFNMEEHSIIISNIPFEIEEIKSNPRNLGRRDNPFEKNSATDIDSFVIIQNKTKKYVDIYFIESKISAKVESDTKKSLGNYKKILLHDIFGEPIIHKRLFGGWLKVRCKE
jgi:hypothetical protein